MQFVLTILFFLLPLPLIAGEHRRFEMTVSPGARTATVHAYLFNSRHEVFRVVDQQGIAGQKHADLGAACLAAGALAGVNGGFFDPQGQPLGLMIASGKRSGSPALAGSLTSGVVWSDGKRNGMVRTAAYDLGPSAAPELLQAGPFLIESGKSVAGLEATRFSRRTIILTDGGDLWAIAYVPSATLDALAKALEKPGAFPPFQPKSVLNLDGGGSSGFWVQRESAQSFYLHEISRVRNFLVVVPKNQG